MERKKIKSKYIEISRRIPNDYTENLIAYDEERIKENSIERNPEKVQNKRETFRDSSNLIKSLFSQIKRNSTDSSNNRSTLMLSKDKNKFTLGENADQYNQYSFLNILNLVTFLIEVCFSLFSIIFFKNSIFSPRIQAINLNIGLIFFWGFWVMIFILTFFYSTYPLLFREKLNFIELIVKKEIGFWRALSGFLWSGFIILSGLIRFNKNILFIFLLLSFCLKFHVLLTFYMKVKYKDEGQYKISWFIFASYHLTSTIQNFWITYLFFSQFSEGCYFYSLHFCFKKCYNEAIFLLINSIETSIYFAYYKDFFYLLSSFLFYGYFFVFGKFHNCHHTKNFNIFLIIFSSAAIIVSFLMHFDTIFYFVHQKQSRHLAEILKSKKDVIRKTF